MLYAATFYYCRNVLSALTLLACLVLSGCQEDSRATKTSTQRASELADSRLDQATDGLLNTLGQARTHAGGAAIAPRELRWNAPLTREDGSALAPGQIAGFRIYFRLRHQASYQVIRIDSPSITRYALDGLPAGAYEFTITTVDNEGLESRRSEPVAVDLI